MVHAYHTARYYIDLLFLCLKEERSYDRVPNFTVSFPQQAARRSSCVSHLCLVQTPAAPCTPHARPGNPPPRLQAADALRLTGVGRNEYIAILNACKSKKLLWRVNKGLARDLLPQVCLWLLLLLLLLLLLVAGISRCICRVSLQLQPRVGDKG
jgi:hypothetical protein